MNTAPRFRSLRARVTGTVLLGAVLTTTACTSVHHPDPGVIGPASGAPSVAVQAPVVASVDAAFPKKPAFGLTLPDLTQANIDKVASSVSCKPTITQRFTALTNGISAKTLRSTTGTPLLSLEPWHPDGGAKQADFTLKDTIQGKWDTQYKQVAQALIDYHDIVLLRFAHEMNGNWYPWGITNGNTAADFVQAWRHVVDLFRAAGATNVLWVWSPNILRGSNSTQISQFWPGPDYVDIVGLTGYGVRESSPHETYDATMKLINSLTTKPVLLTEIGVQPDPGKQKWINSFGQWLKDNTQVIGFVWFENNRTDDWRFDDNQADLAAFKNSLKIAGVSC